MRIRVFREARPTHDDRLVLPGAITWAGNPVPAMALPEKVTKADGKYGSWLVGTVTDLRREDEGWITGELRVSGFDPKGKVAQAALETVEYERTDDYLAVRKARLAGVVLGDSPCWDDMVIE